MSGTRRARLTRREQLSAAIAVFTFESLEAPFTGLEAGAHVELRLGPDLVRSYSLVDWDTAGRWVQVAVQAEPRGRGGSLAVHRLQPGDELTLTDTRNNFPLATSERPVVLIGGGIGVTPIYAMARALARLGRHFEVYYFVRTEDLAAFHGHLLELGLGERYLLHRDDVDGLPDFTALLRERPPDTVYQVCGPEAMLEAVQVASRNLGRGIVTFERFGPARPAVTDDDHPFDVVIASTGQELPVPVGRSILSVLRQAGHDIDYSCAEGTCGTCIIDVLDGEIEHRDVVLDDDEKAAGDCLCVCVSRARGPRLVLDL